MLLIPTPALEHHRCLSHEFTLRHFFKTGLTKLRTSFLNKDNTACRHPYEPPHIFPSRRGKYFSSGRLSTVSIAAASSVQQATRPQTEGHDHIQENSKAIINLVKRIALIYYKCITSVLRNLIRVSQFTYRCLFGKIRNGLVLLLLNGDG